MPNPLFAQPTAPELTEQQIADRKMQQAAVLPAQLAGASMQLLERLDMQVRDALASVWQHPYLTPQEAIDALGTSAAVFAAGNSATVTFLASMYAMIEVPYTPPALPEGLTLVVNEDGTATVEAI